MKDDKDFYDSYDDKKGNGVIFAFAIIFGAIIFIISISVLIYGEPGMFIFACIYIMIIVLYIYIQKKNNKLSDDFVPTNKTKDELMDEYVIKNKIKEQQREKAIAYLANTEAQELLNKPHCPYCNSTNLKRITTTAKAVNIAMFGLLGNKRKYQWHCNNCKTDF